MVQGDADKAYHILGIRKRTGHFQGDDVFACACPYKAYENHLFIEQGESRHTGIGQIMGKAYFFGAFCHAAIDYQRIYDPFVL